MILFPAIDLYEGKAVRLYQGDYRQMTVYSDDPARVAEDFQRQGATHLHLVDLEGAKNGTTPNLRTVERILAASGLFVEIGGGIRDLATVKRYAEVGAKRIILGTAAVKDPAFLQAAVAAYGDRIAVGVDVKDGCVAVNGWLEKTKCTCFDFCEQLQALGVKTVICTDIQRDGAMQGAGIPLYEQLMQRFSMQFIASGGVSSLSDIRRLREMGLYGAIVGKAYYTGAISLREAIEVAR